jgi:hypothetical protein
MLTRVQDIFNHPQFSSTLARSVLHGSGIESLLSSSQSDEEKLVESDESNESHSTELVIAAYLKEMEVCVQCLLDLSSAITDHVADPDGWERRTTRGFQTKSAAEEKIASTYTTSLPQKAVSPLVKYEAVTTDYNFLRSKGVEGWDDYEIVCVPNPITLPYGQTDMVGLGTFSIGADPPKRPKSCTFSPATLFLFRPTSAL